jgi:hypothetical protein
VGAETTWESGSMINKDQMPTDEHAFRVYHHSPRYIVYADPEGRWRTPAGYVIEEDIADLLTRFNVRLQSEGPLGSRKTDLRITIATTVAVILVLIGALIVLRAFLTPDRYKTYAEFGDYIAGTVGSTWALAGVLLVYVAFLGQQNQANLQAWEIQQTVRMSRIQQFENTFFQLVNLHNEIVRSLRVTITSGPFWDFEKLEHQWITNEVDGREIFGAIYKRFKEAWTKEHEVFAEQKDVVIDILPLDQELELVRRAYEPIHERYISELGHYFRNLYTIVKYVATSGIEEPRKYTNILRAQLSSTELLMLFYNCVSKYGNEDFKPLVEEFRLLKTVPYKDLLNRTHASAFSAKAYGKNASLVLRETASTI